MTADPIVLQDENEQLRVSLETALEQNARLDADLGRSRRSLTLLAGERQAAIADAGERESRARLPVEEELRSAYEELQVLAEELEVTNVNLQQVNTDLDTRVDDRTTELARTMLALRTVADLVPDLLWRADPLGQIDWFNRRWYDYTGLDEVSSMDSGWIDRTHPEDRFATVERWRQAVATSTPYAHEHRIRGADDSYRWFRVRIEPTRSQIGAIVHWFGAGTDIQDQRVAMEALQQSEQRFRTLVEGMPQLIWRATEGGDWTWSSPQWQNYTGLSEQESLGLGWATALHPDDMEAGRKEWVLADLDAPFDMSARIFHAAEARYRHFRVRALPALGVDGRPFEWLGTFTDVDDMLQLQEQQSVLVSELQHRTRNLMAVVYAVTVRTLKGSRDLDHFRRCIDDRLQALARVQGLLSSREGAARVAFDKLVREEFSVHVEVDAEGQSEQLSTSGPSGIALRSSTVQTLALAIHELATNAVKYGAFAVPAGHLDLSWRVDPDGQGGERLLVDWRETGVTTNVVSDQLKPGGYGRELIERALPYQLGARTSYAIEEGGVHCTIEVSVATDDKEWGSKP